MRFFVLSRLLSPESAPAPAQSEFSTRHCRLQVKSAFVLGFRRSAGRRILLSSPVRDSEMRQKKRRRICRGGAANKAHLDVQGRVALISPAAGGGPFRLVWGLLWIILAHFGSLRLISHKDVRRRGALFATLPVQRPRQHDWVAVVIAGSSPKWPDWPFALNGHLVPRGPRATAFPPFIFLLYIARSHAHARARPTTNDGVRSVGAWLDWKLRAVVRGDGTQAPETAKAGPALVLLQPLSIAMLLPGGRPERPCLFGSYYARLIATPLKAAAPNRSDLFLLVKPTTHTCTVHGATRL